MTDRPKVSFESSKDASDVPEREVLTQKLFREASHRLTRQIVTSGWIPDLIVATTRGGLVPAGTISYAIGIKACGTMDVEFYAGVGQTLEELQLLPPLMDVPAMSDKRILAVGDVADSGKTLKMIMNLVKKRGLSFDGETQVKVDACCTVIYKKPVSIIEPDYVWRHTDKRVNSPWSTLPTVTV